MLEGDDRNFGFSISALEPMLSPVHISRVEIAALVKPGLSVHGGCKQEWLGFSVLKSSLLSFSFLFPFHSVLLSCNDLLITFYLFTYLFIAQTGLGHSMWARLSLNSLPSCLCLPSAVVTVVHHHFSLIWCLRGSSGLSAHRASIRASELHLQPSCLKKI